jgi:hypothetical protein
MCYYVKIYGNVKYLQTMLMRRLGGRLSASRANNTSY